MYILVYILLHPELYIDFFFCVCRILY
uniref:Uncharacterized protein n=1 Tax=Rhizophora mucronata TaxID=61149 RepID=A0A2P2PCD6_RHIMU